MTRTCYDGINSDATSIPADAQLVAGYVDGLYAWSAADWARFPHAVHVEIAVSPATNAGVVQDVEQGNGTPAESVDWVLMRRAAGVDPTVYCNTMTWPAVQAAFEARGVAQPHYWIAQYDGIAQIPAGAVAKQYESTADWDLSVVADYWPGVDPAPAPTPAPVPAPSLQEDDVTTYFPIQVQPDPKGTANACGVATWPAGAAHVIQLLADPGVWGAKQGEFRLVFNLTTGPDVEMTHITGPGDNTEIEFATVTGLTPAACRGVTITRPDGATWPWGGGAA